MVYNDGKEEFYDEYYDKENLSHFLFKFDLSLLVTGKYIRLEVTKDEIYLKNGKIYEIVLKSPVLIEPETAFALFDSKTRCLNL